MKQPNEQAILIQDISPSKLKYNTGQLPGIPKNPRFIKDDKYKKLIKSLADNPEMLYVREVVAVSHDGELVVVGGNMRARAATELGIKDIPVKILPDDWTPEQVRAFIIKDNVPYGENDWDLLANEWDIDELTDWGLELPDFIQEEPEVEEDEAPEVSTEPPVSVLGEIYQLGRHRVMCGDSTNKASVELLMNGVKADMVFTDPPYGMNYSGRGENTSNKIMGDTLDPTEFYNIGSEISERYIWGRVENYKHLATEPRDTIIWKKNNFGMGRGYRGQYECCFYYGDFSGSDSDVWDFAKDSKYEHPTQKPVGLCARAIHNSQPKVVIDYFLGSGSTLIACEQTDRTCYGMELDPKYVDVIRKRYWKFINNNNEEGWEDGTRAVEQVA
jgi:site-specific DNA-methyltransferase (adenine-specific)